MDAKQPIPVPPAQRWREFRIQLLPFVVFLIVAIVIALLWKNIVVPVNFVGEVATVQYQVRTLQDGTLIDLRVEQFAFVHKGDEIGTVQVMEATNLTAEIAVAISTLELERLRTGINVNRSILEVTSLNIAKQLAVKSLELAKADMATAAAEYERAKNMFSDKLLTQLSYDVAASVYEKAKTSVAELTSILASYSKQAKVFEDGNYSVTMYQQNNTIDLAIKAKTNEVIILNRPQILIAPADGIVGLISHRPGEKVRAGDPLVMITSTNSNYIIGYVRQPLNLIPSVNDEVQVRSRASHRATASAKVMKIGAELDFMNPLIITPDNTRKEKALQVMISVPPELNLHPGEFVDLMLNKK